MKRCTPKRRRISRDSPSVIPPSREGSKRSFCPGYNKVKATDFCISNNSFERFYQSWANPAAFFDQSARLTKGDIVSRVYEELLHICQRDVDDPIRTRIYAIALCDLRCLVDERFFSDLRPGVEELIAQIISDSPMVKDSLEEVMRWVELFVKFG